MLPPCENRAEACWQPVDFKLGKPMSARYSGGFPINLKSDNNVTIMLDFRAKAASIKPRRSSGVRSLHDSRASLRKPANDGVANNPRIRGESQAHLASYGDDGNRSRLPEAQAEPAWGRPQDLPIPVERIDGRPSRSGLEHRYHVYQDGAGLRVPGGGDGLV